jgi:hypothetical protein
MTGLVELTKAGKVFAAQFCHVRPYFKRLSIGIGAIFRCPSSSSSERVPPLARPRAIHCREAVDRARMFLEVEALAAGELEADWMRHGPFSGG